MSVSTGYKQNIKRSLRAAIRLFVLVVLISIFTDSGTALGLFIEEEKLVGVGGWSVAISGDRIVVGSPAKDSQKGAIHVYHYDNSTMTWVEEQSLIASDGAAGDQFGFSVAMADDRIVVGAPFDNDNGSQSGSAYVFRFYPETMTWLQEQKISASDGAPNDFFGVSIGISGDRIVIGSPVDDDKASRSGAVYVYRFDSVTTMWIQEEKLVASDGMEEDSLGWSVAVEGDRIVAGAIQTNNCMCNPGRSGAAYVFNRKSGSWEFEAKLIPFDGLEDDLFGNSVSISADRIVVGTWFANYAYVFSRDNDTMLWVAEQKLGPSDGSTSSTFGFDVAIAGDQLVVGAPGGNEAYLFEYDGETGAWVQVQNLTPREVSEAADFGRSVGIAGDLVAVGSQGSAHIFRFSPDSDGDGVPDEQDQCPNSDRRFTVIIDGRDSGVANALLTEPAGCTITDEILNLAVDARSHGQFVSKVDKFLLDLQEAGILEPDEKNAIKEAAAQSTLP